MFVIKPLLLATTDPDATPRRPKAAAPGDNYVTPAQAAAMLGVSSRTIGRWAALGHLPYITTLGGHRRFRESDVLRLLDKGLPGTP